MSALAAVDVERPPIPPRGWTRHRVLGYALVGLWVVLLVALVAYLVSAWNAELFEKYAPGYVSGLVITLELVAISIVAGAVLSAPVAYARMSSDRILSGLASVTPKRKRQDEIATTSAQIHFARQCDVTITGMRMAPCKPFVQSEILPAVAHPYVPAARGHESRR